MTNDTERTLDDSLAGLKEVGDCIDRLLESNRCYRAEIDRLRASNAGLRAMNETLATEVNFHRQGKAEVLAAAVHALAYIQTKDGEENSAVQLALKDAIAHAEEPAS